MYLTILMIVTTRGSTTSLPNISLCIAVYLKEISVAILYGAKFDGGNIDKVG